MKSWIDKLPGGLYSPLGLCLTFGVAFGLFGGLIYGIIGGFTGKIKEGKALPNQGIFLTIKNGVVVCFIAIASIVLLGGLIRWLNGTLYSEPPFYELLIFCSSVGFIVALNCGLGGVIKHYILHFVLWRSGKTPFRFIPFLDYCAKLILLKKVGGGYIFIHRMLLEYFAKLGVTDK